MGRTVGEREIFNRWLLVEYERRKDYQEDVGYK